MISSACRASVNELLIAADRGLLQYVGECWPWSSDDESELRHELDGLIKRQKNDVARLVDYLNAHRLPVDFDNYPTEFTDKHFLSIDFLLPQILENEREIKTICEITLTAYVEDTALAEIVNQMLANENDSIDRLQKLIASRKSVVA